MRAGSLPRNEQLADLVKESNARNQVELVEAKTMTRKIARTGVKIEELGKEGPSSKINSMSQQDLSDYLRTLLKSKRVVQRVELFKSQQLEDEAFVKERTRVVNVTLLQGSVSSFERIADKLANEFSKGNIAGVDLDAEGKMKLYEWKPIEKPVAKKKEEAVVVESEPVPLIRLHYLLF